MLYFLEPIIYMEFSNLKLEKFREMDYKQLIINQLSNEINSYQKENSYEKKKEDIISFYFLRALLKISLNLLLPGLQG